MYMNKIFLIGGATFSFNFGLFMTAFEVPGNLLDSMPNINESDIIRKPIEEERFINKIKTAVNLE